MNDVIRPKIVNYNDYRIFLKDIFWYQKKQSKAVSYEYYSRKLRASKSYFKQVFDLKSHIALNKVAIVSDLFQLSSFEREYFMILLIENQLEDKNMKLYFSQILTALKVYDSNEGFKEHRESAGNLEGGLPDSLSMIIAGLIKFDDFQLDAQWIQKKLCSNFTIEEINQSIDTVLKRKILVRNGDQYEMPILQHANPILDSYVHKQYISGAQLTLDLLKGDADQMNRHSPSILVSAAVAATQEDFDRLAEAYSAFAKVVSEIDNKNQKADKVFYLFTGLYKVADNFKK